MYFDIRYLYRRGLGGWSFYLSFPVNVLSRNDAWVLVDKGWNVFLLLQ